MYSFLSCWGNLTPSSLKCASSTSLLYILLREKIIFALPAEILLLAEKDSRLIRSGMTQGIWKSFILFSKHWTKYYLLFEDWVTGFLLCIVEQCQDEEIRPLSLAFRLRYLYKHVGNSYSLEIWIWKPTGRCTWKYDLWQKNCKGESKW